MSEKKEVYGKFRYEQDSKRFHRFQVITDTGIIGSIYVPKSAEAMPKKLVLDYEGKSDNA